MDALKSDAKRRKLFSATVKKETKHILAPETQYRPDSPRLESRSQVLAPETQDGPDSPPLESQPKGLASETQNGPDSSPLESQSQGLAPELLYGPDSQPLESQSVLGKCKQYVAKKCKIKELLCSGCSSLAGKLKGSSRAQRAST